jgi:hypothetical protein
MVVPQKGQLAGCLRVGRNSTHTEMELFYLEYPGLFRTTVDDDVISFPKD